MLLWHSVMYRSSGALLFLCSREATLQQYAPVANLSSSRMKIQLTGLEDFKTSSECREDEKVANEDCFALLHLTFIFDLLFYCAGRRKLLQKTQ